jgi:hypothetical protein
MAVKLTVEQKSAVARWAAEGASMNEIQDRLKSELGITLTFMDTRFLVSDLKLTLKADLEAQAEEEKKAAAAAAIKEAEEAAAQSLGMNSGSAEDGNFGREDEGMGDFPSGGNVTVSLDQLAIPGTMVSGKVTFSDGEKASWYLDQTGRLGLADAPPGYRPSEEDLMKFQMELQKIMRGAGSY